MSKKVKVNPTMTKPHVLVLGGSTQARQLISTIADDYTITLSLAGTTRTPSPILPKTIQRRTGGFGGVNGLAAYLHDARVDAVVDATHPYAAQMHHNAVNACAQMCLPHLRLERPAWVPPAGAIWIEVEGGEAAVDQVRTHGWRRVFVTTGRVFLDPWRSLGPDITVVVRSIDPADLTGIDRVEAITQRGPFTLDDEVAILRECDALVTRNSGGDDAKIRAALLTQTPILVWRRPPLPPCTTVPDVSGVITWLRQTVSQP